MGPVLGSPIRTDCTQSARVAEPRLPAPEDGRPGEGQRLTPDAPHNVGRPPPPGTAPHHLRGGQPPQGMQAKGTALGPHTRPPVPTARGRRTPTARPEGGQSREGERLTSDAPHNGERHPPRGRPSATPTASNAGPQGPHGCMDRTRDTRVAEPRLPAPEDGRPVEGQCLTPDAPNNGGRPPHPGTAHHHPRGTQPPQGMPAKATVLGPHSRTPAPTARGRRTPTVCLQGGQSGEGERLTSDAPHKGERHPTPARKGARCGASAGSPRPHGPHPEHKGRETATARSRGRAVGRGTAPDTRRPSQRWQATPPGTAPHHSRGTEPPQGIQGPRQPAQRAGSWARGTI